MTKTIEEAAVGYAADKMCVALGLTPGCINRTDALIPKFCGRDIEEAYEDGENRIMSLPLSGRMTAEEKERVRKEYNWYKVNLSQLRECGFNELDPDVVLCSGIMRTLNRIFGKDFFKEEE